MTGNKKGRWRRPGSALVRGYFADFIGQVLSPMIEYSGQVLSTPVASGTTPIQPHGPIVPISVRPIRTSPATMRSVRSIPPTLVLNIRFPFP